jgi:hypothetical protein
MNSFTTKQMQDMANNKNKPVCGWIPKPIPSNYNPAEDELRWVYDSSGAVKEYKNPDPNLSDTDPWENTHSFKRLFRPKKGGVK